MDAIEVTGSALLSSQSLIYVVVEEHTGAKPPFIVLSTTEDLKLANELAVKHFRDACFKYHPSITAEPRKSWVRVDGDGNQADVLNWGLVNGECIRPSASAPGSESRVTVRVEAQVLSVSA